MRWWTFIVGWSGHAYPMAVDFQDLEYAAEKAAQIPNRIMFVAQVPNLDEDIRWFDGQEGPDWNLNLDDYLKEVMGETSNAQAAPAESG